MQGLMQDWPLLCSKLIDHAAHWHGDREIVSRSVEGPIHRTNYASVRERALKVAQRLEKDGIVLGDRCATLAWNTWRHLEVWYGVMGIGAIYHTINPRLFVDQIVWIINDAADRLLFVDLTFVPLIEKIIDKLPGLERVIILTDAAHMPETVLPRAVAYEEWIAEVDGDFRWLEFAETTAAGMCYTSGTTGTPKGVLYSHRSNIIHSWLGTSPDMIGLAARDAVLSIVPLFHANSWGLAFTAPMVGAKLVLPGAKLDGASVHELLETERVTCTAAVPTVWLMLLQHLEATGGALSTLKRVIIGGSACPRALTEVFLKKYGVEVRHAWGMTETSPLATVCAVKPETDGDDVEAWLDLQVKQGIAPFGVEMRIVDDQGRVLPHDGNTFGRLQVRGPAIASSYYKGVSADSFKPDGFFDTGDVATIDPYGYMRITDRSKDVIKSGGEWISSIDLENVAVGHPDVLEAAVIGIHHPTWDERPLLIIVPKKGRAPSRTDILNFLEGKIAKWWMPDDVVFAEEIPHTATGKVLKTALRERFKDYQLPTG
jgi:fatty-acyl-CoA synthase